MSEKISDSDKADLHRNLPLLEGLGLSAEARVLLAAHARASNSDLQRRRWEELVARLEAMSTVLDRETSVALAAILEGQERLLAACGGGGGGGNAGVWDNSNWDQANWQ